MAIVMHLAGRSAGRLVRGVRDDPNDESKSCKQMGAFNFHKSYCTEM